MSVARVRRRLEELFAIGGGRGANRPGLSAAEEEAHRLVAGWMEEAGLEVSRDGAGNLFGRRPGRRPELGEAWLGSHLDTVPDGGRFDGALGVVAAVEALAASAAPEAALAAVAFRDEEGVRFGAGCFGSRAAAGALLPADLERRDVQGTSVAEALAELGLAPAAALAGGPLPRAYVEAHVEQGPRLERLGRPLGVVSAIAGMAGLAVELRGAGGHAGTVPMRGRHDALAAAARAVLALREATDDLDAAVATVGECSVAAPAPNVIPARVRLSADLRAPDGGALRTLLARAGEALAAAAAAEGCEARVELRYRDEPVSMDAGLVELLRESAAGAGHEPPVLASGAGHDAGILAAAGVRSAMLFVRSVAEGVSHVPEEWSDDEAIGACLDVLSEFAGRLGAGALRLR